MHHNEMTHDYVEHQRAYAPLELKPFVLHTAGFLYLNTVPIRPEKQHAAQDLGGIPGWNLHQHVVHISQSAVPTMKPLELFPKKTPEKSASHSSRFPDSSLGSTDLVCLFTFLFFFFQSH